MEIDQARLKVQLLCSTIADRLLEAVAAQVTVGILLGAEGIEGVLICPIDWRASQAEEKSVR